MPTLYCPQTNQPVHVMDSRVSDYLKLGYRTSPPGGTPRAEVVQAVVQQQGVSLDGRPVIEVNKDTLAELSEKLEVATVIARKIRQHRPYTTPEDLINAVPEVNWLTYNLVF